MVKSAKSLDDNFLNSLPAPAKRALENYKITTLKKLTNYSESDILKLHGIGPSAIPILKNCLEKAGLSFNKLGKNNTDEIKEYISRFPKKTQSILNKIRKLILSADKNIIESISYGMPAYKFKKKPVMYFAAYENHIGIYATPNAHEEFKKELSEYKQGKGSVQFPLEREIPYGLIEKMLTYNLSKY